MLVSFHGCRAIGRAVAASPWPPRRAIDGCELHRGGKLASDGAHPIEQDAEQDLRVEPRDDGVVTVVGQTVAAAERLPALELQLDLPAQSVGVETLASAHALAGHRGEEHDVTSGLQALVGDLGSLLLAQSLACLLCLVSRQTSRDQSPGDA